MAGADYVLDKGFIAESAIGTAGTTTLDHFRCVIFGTGPERVTLAGAAGQVVGIAQQPAAAADVTVGKQAIDVRILGVSKAVAGAAVSLGARVASDATGRVVTSAVAANPQVGIALTAAGAAGDIIDVLLTPGVKVGA